MKKLHILFNILIGFCPLGLCGSFVSDDFRSQLQSMRSGMSDSLPLPSSVTPRLPEDSAAREDLEMAPEAFAEKLASVPEKELLGYLYRLADTYCKMSKSPPNAQWFDQAPSQQKKITQVCTKIRQIVQSDNVAFMTVLLERLNVNSDQVKKLAELEGNKISGYSSLISLLQDQFKSTSTTQEKGPVLKAALALQIISGRELRGTLPAESQTSDLQDNASMKSRLQRAASSGSFAKHFQPPSKQATDDSRVDDSVGAVARTTSSMVGEKKSDGVGDDFDDSVSLAQTTLTPPPAPAMPAAGLKSKRLPTSAVPAPVSLPAGASQVGTREHRKSSPASIPAANGDELKRSIAASSERRKSGGSSIMPIDKSARPTAPKADNDDVNQRRKAQRERIEASANPSEPSTNGKRLLISSGPSGLQRTHSLPNVPHVQGGNQNRQSGNSQQLGLSKDSLMSAQALSQSTAPRRMSGRPLPQPQQRNSSEPHKDSKLPLRGQSPDTAATPEIVGDASYSTVPSMKGAHAASTSSIGHVRALSKPAVVAPPSEAGAVSTLANAHSSAVVAKDSAAPSHVPLTTPRNGQPDTSARSTHKNGSSLLSASESITPTRTPPAADQNPETRASTSSRSETTNPVLPGATSKPAVDSGLSPSLVSESTTPTRTQSPADQGPVLTTIVPSVTAGTSVASVDPEMSHPVLPESISKSAPPSVSQRTTVASVQFTTGQTSVAMSSSSSTETNVGDFSSQQSSAPGSARPPVSSIVPGGVVPTVSALVLGGTLGGSPGAQPVGSLSIGGSPLLPPVHQTPHTPISAPKKPALSYEKPEGLKMNRVLTIVALAGLGAWAFKLYYLDPRHINTSDGFYHRGEIR